jgi:hypothetical protein
MLVCAVFVSVSDALALRRRESVIGTNSLPVLPLALCSAASPVFEAGRGRASSERVFHTGPVTSHCARCARTIDGPL